MESTLGPASAALPPNVRATAAQALKKRGRSEKLNRAEDSALRRVENAWRLDQLRQLVTAVPKKLYVEWSGRQYKVLLEQAQRYGIPLAGESVNVPAVLRAFHQFIADNKHRLTVDDIENGPETEWLDKMRKEKTLILRIERLERESSLVRKSDVSAIFDACAARLRQLGEQMQSAYGVDALEIVNEAIDDLGRVRILRDARSDDRDGMDEEFEAGEGP